MKAPHQRIPDMVGPLVGFRVWNGDPITRQLHSIYNNILWEPYRAFKADCARRTNPTNYDRMCSDAPDFYCTCGIYAYRDFQKLDDAMRRERQGPGYVMGQVALWGQVVEHEDGWRAEFAYPLSLNSQSSADVYGVEFRPRYHEALGYRSPDDMNRDLRRYMYGRWEL